MVFKLLKTQPINYIFSRIIKLLKIDPGFFFPVVGRFKVNVSYNLGFYMKSDGGDSIASRLFLYGPKRFEHESLAIFAKIIRYDSIKTVLDIGANTGVYSLICGASNEHLHVHAFEPMPNIFRRLCENVKTNSFRNIQSHELALSDRTGELEFYYVPAITVPTGGSAAKSNWIGAKKVVVQTTTLDSFCSKNSLSKVDLIKIDTEMTEPQVLVGGRNIIEKSKPFIICEVLDENSANALTELLKPLGYDFFHITNNGLKNVNAIAHDPTYTYANYLFAHKDRSIGCSLFPEGLD